MNNTDFNTTILVDQSPETVFNAVNNVSGWWSEEVKGTTDKLNGEFDYHFKDVHISKMRIIEFEPGKKVVWHVLENSFNFIEDQTEWKDTKIIFEISKEGNKTRLHFTHQGLIPAYECYEICHKAWNTYIQKSLHDLITTGKGQPNPKEGGFNEELLHEYKNSYHTSIVTDASPQHAFDCINNVSQWWTSDLTGASHKLNDEFTVQFGDVHLSTQRLVEFVPAQKVVWLVTSSRLNFLEDKQEWTNTRISFEISVSEGKTKIDFTHFGLVPAVECYESCSDVWGKFIHLSLLSLINTGKGVDVLNGAI